MSVTARDVTDRMRSDIYKANIVAPFDDYFDDAARKGDRTATITAKLTARSCSIDTRGNTLVKDASGHNGPPDDFLRQWTSL
jgi:cation transport regulator ChaB